MATRMPPEWSPHSATLILYPHNECVFRSPTATAAPPHSPPPTAGACNCDEGQAEKCGPARAEVRNVARSIAKCGEDVVVLCQSEADGAELERRLGEGVDAGGAGGANGGVAEGGRGSGRGSGSGEIKARVCPSDDSWVRDTGPTFVVAAANAAGDNDNDETNREDTQNDGGGDDGGKVEQHLVGLDWNFNAYGGPDHGCYWPCDFDRAVASNVIDILNNNNGGGGGGGGTAAASASSAAAGRIRHRSVNLILEGGSIHTDGDGTILTTAECLLNPNRNPTLTQTSIETQLCKELGATKVLWLPNGLANDDDTNGHVDNLAAFVKPGEVVLAWTDDEENDAQNYRRCRAAEQVLRGEVDARGRKVLVHRLKLPRPMHFKEEEVRTLATDDGTATRVAGERLAASYVNFYICNNGIILPQFGDVERDSEAVTVMEGLFPDRQVIGVYSREILLGGGNIHCITQQVPCLL